MNMELQHEIVDLDKEGKFQFDRIKEALKMMKA